MLLFKKKIKKRFNHSEDEHQFKEQAIWYVKFKYKDTDKKEFEIMANNIKNTIKNKINQIGLKNSIIKIHNQTNEQWKKCIDFSMHFYLDKNVMSFAFNHYYVAGSHFVLIANVIFKNNIEIYTLKKPNFSNSLLGFLCASRVTLDYYLKFRKLENYNIQKNYKCNWYHSLLNLSNKPENVKSKIWIIHQLVNSIINTHRNIWIHKKKIIIGLPVGFLHNNEINNNVGVLYFEYDLNNPISIQDLAQKIQNKKYSVIGTNYIAKKMSANINSDSYRNIVDVVLSLAYFRTKKNIPSKIDFFTKSNIRGYNIIYAACVSVNKKCNISLSTNYKDFNHKLFNLSLKN